MNYPLLRSPGEVQVELSLNNLGKHRIFLENKKKAFHTFGMLQTEELLADRCTVLKKEETELYCVEHLSAALLFFREQGIDIRLNRAEVPLLDGSAKRWVDLFTGLGSKPSPLPDFYDCDLSWERAWPGGKIRVESAESFRVDWTMRDGNLEQKFSLHSDENDSAKKFSELLNARTFIREDEFLALESVGVFPGAQEGMGIVWKEEKGRALYLQGKPARFPHEFARHKVLDLMGDLGLYTGALPKLHIEVTNGGHRVNHLLIKRMLDHVTT